WLIFEAHEIVHPNGSPGEHGVTRVPNASAVVVLDGGEVVLTAQPRYAVERTVLEVPKGGAHPGESALQCAERETREEVGALARRWTPLGAVHEIPSIVAASVSLFLARECIFGEVAPEHVESIEIVRMPFERAVRMALDGELDDAISVVALVRANDAIARGV
ncbi:MAG: NUDIX hydrolase, partial [Candidatus Eremiobacteraeota bacterium]|nr:NUDIX hydrolase [Candidatus Eremiobacteraeota bacterium]